MSAAGRGAVRIGTSGWSYDHWDGVLYPPRTPVRARLEHYVRAFDAVEVNTSFYRWPPPATFAGWAGRFPPGFTAAVKASRFLTHYRRLRDPDTWLERVREGLAALGPHAGPLLVQLRPDHARDDERLERFLERVPTGVRVAVEFRHDSWDADPVADVLTRHGAAWCVTDGAGLPTARRLTTDVGYLRLHGPADQPRYAGGYSEQQLRGWADLLERWRTAAHQVHVYFDNDIGGHAVHDARRLRELLRQEEG